MRVLIDTNIFISYLLKSDQDRTISSVIEAGFEGEYTILLPQEVLEEVHKKLTEKKYLASRISSEEAKEFTQLLEQVAEAIPTITEDIPAVTRDRKDDYLIAYAVVGKADFLVSGDEDLRKVVNVGGVTIVSPADFLNILAKE